MGTSLLRMEPFGEQTRAVPKSGGAFISPQSLVSLQWPPGAEISRPGEAGTWEQSPLPMTLGQYVWERFFPRPVEHGEKLQGEVFRPGFLQGNLL